jgi:hypothetical protein
MRLDCDGLPPAQTARLRDLVQRAHFFSLPTKSPAPNLPDARAYTIAVADGPQCKTVTVAEPIENAALRDLVAELREHARAARGGT